MFIELKNIVTIQLPKNSRREYMFIELEMWFYANPVGIICNLCAFLHVIPTGLV
jgi:hypothetical protein